MTIVSSVFPDFSYTSFKVSGLILRSLIHFELILYRVTNTDLVSVFCRLISVLPATFVEEAVFSLLYVFGTVLKN
jgi:hypothetical protein